MYRIQRNHVSEEHVKNTNVKGLRFRIGLWQYGLLGESMNIS